MNNKRFSQHHYKVSTFVQAEGSITITNIRFLLVVTVTKSHFAAVVQLD